MKSLRPEPIFPSVILLFGDERDQPMRLESPEAILIAQQEIDFLAAHVQPLFLHRAVRYIEAPEDMARALVVHVYLEGLDRPVVLIGKPAVDIRYAGL